MEERAAGLILFRENCGRREYLLIKNRRGGHWGFPKGHVEPGEDDFQAALREAAEEVHIRRIQLIPGFRTVVRYAFPRQSALVRKEVVLFLARTDEEGQPFREEVEDMAWLPFPEALQRITFAEQREALRQAEDWLSAG
ncbi:MAG: NUDIX domain-containing protein [Candidatus Bipolaricaulaceae bacterium]|nr:NUDIX domain-containing protein [Candidatus Bipolaricaulota bacterium]MCX7844642.1 NUDIX domain-containing protein [Candidatus Bipolaricaulota bacterium]MDW8151654.1 NUDIX domain-containing protein [Candidatus Bipolaricaulota bacterium]